MWFEYTYFITITIKQKLCRSSNRAKCVKFSQGMSHFVTLRIFGQFEEMNLIVLLE